MAFQAVHLPYLRSLFPCQHVISPNYFISDPKRDAVERSYARLGRAEEDQSETDATDEGGDREKQETRG